MKEKFLDLIEIHQGIIHKILSIYTYNEEEKKDLLQEIMLQLWKSYHSFSERSSFSTWMYKVALNTALLNLRRKRFRVRTESLREHHLSIPADTSHSEKEGIIGRLYEAINQLNKFDRAIILLFLEEFSYKEIAEVTGISESNVSVRLVRIKKKLKEILDRGQ